MPIIPIPDGLRRVARDSFDESEAARYRAEADAKLKRLQDTPMAQLGPDEPLKGDFKRPAWMGSRGYDTPDFTSSAEPTIVPAEGDQSRDLNELGLSPRFSEELSRPAAPESNVPDVGFGSGGPEGGVLSEATILDIRQRLADKQASTTTDKDMRSRLLQGVNPDEAASAIDLAAKSGVNRLQVEVNPETYKRADTMRQIDQLRTTAPKLRAWLDYNPENLDVSHDDVENLSWWEQIGSFLNPGSITAEEVGGALRTGAVEGGAQQFYGAAEAGIGINRMFEFIPGMKALNDAGETAARTERQKAAITAAANMPKGDTWLERGIYGAAQSAPASIEAMIVSVLTKNPLPGVATMGVATGGQAYGEAEDAGKPFLERMRYAVTQGGIEAATEFLPLKFIVGDLAKDTPLGKMFLKNALAEGIGEQAATFLQDASTWLELNPEKTLGEFMAERPNAALETLVASTLMSGVQTTIAKGAQVGVDQFDQNAQQKRAEGLAKTFEAMAAGAGSSKLLKRLPEKYRDVVAAVTKDGPLESVRVQPEAFNELAQSAGVTTEQLAQAFRIDPADIVSAIESGEDVVIPSGNYAAALSTAKKEIGISGEQIHTAFAPNMRLRADDFTAKEREAMKAVFEEEQAARAESGTKEQGFADSADRVRETIREQVASLKIFNTEAANTQAAIVGEMVTTLAERTGQDPETLWKEQGFDIVTSLMGEDQDAGASLPQSTARTPVSIDNIELDWASQDLEPRQFEAWKGAREGLSNEQIADRINEVEPDARVTALNVRGFISKARSMGYDVEKAATRSAADKTRRLIDLAARGISNQQIADRLYRDDGRPRDKILNSIKVLKSQRKAEIAARKDELAGALTQGERGTFTPRADRSIIRLFESANLSTLVHEGAHWYLDTLWRMAQTETPHPFVLEQIAAILEWQGKSPNWTAMFDADGKFTAEGRDIQEAFAESFEAYLREGKAPTTALRSVFASFKAWLSRIYRSISQIGGRVRLNDEIRQVFDRMLATEDAIKAATTSQARDSAAMAQALLAKGIITEKAVERTTARLAAAKERAEAELMARLMEDYERSQKAWWRDEERQVRREVQSEIDERPEQRAYAWLSGKGWRDTREDHTDTALEEAEGMALLQRQLDLPTPEQRAAWVRDNTVSDVIPGEASNSRQYGFKLSNGLGIVASLIPQVNGETEIHWTFLSRLMDRASEEDVYAKGDESLTGKEVLEMMPRILAIVETDMTKEGRDAYTFTSARRSIRNMNARLVRLLQGFDYEIVQFPGQDDPILLHKDADIAGNGKIIPRPENAGRKFEWDRTEDPEAYADAFYAKVSDIGPGRPAGRSDGGERDRPNEARGELADEVRYVDLNATTESLRAMQERMVADNVVPAILLFRTDDGRVIAVSGEDVNFSHDQARDTLGLGDIHLAHGVYNPRRWPTLEAMDEAGLHAWYGTSGRDDGAGVSLAQSAGSPHVAELDAVRDDDAAFAELAQRLAKELTSADLKSLATEYSLGNFLPKNKAEALQAIETGRHLRIRSDVTAEIASKAGLFQSGSDTKGRTAPPPSLPPMRLDLQAVKDQYGEEALANLPPEVAAYSASATDADQFLEVARDVRKTLKQKKPKTLWKYLSTSRVIGSGNDKISYRGIRDDGGELLKIIGEKKAAPGLISDKEDGKRVRSYTIEHAANAAWEAGYFNGPNPPTPAEFLDALRSDFDGQAPLYARADMETVGQIKAAEQWGAWFDQNGIDINEPAETLKPKLETLLTSEQEGAIGPDEAAPFFKMPDGNALLQGLKEGPKRNELIRKETQRRMIEKHGDIFRDGTIMRAAELYARNEVQQRQDEIELEALGRAAGRQFEVNLAKQMARDNLKTKQLREILNYNQWLTLEGRWNKKAIEAATKGDVDKAFDYKRYALINRQMFLEGRKLAEKIEKDVAFLRTFEKKEKRAKLLKAGQDFLDQMDQLLEEIDLRKRSPKDLRERQTLAAWFAEKQSQADPLRNTVGMTPEEVMAAQIEEVERSTAIAAMQQEARLRNYQSLTAEEFSAVRDQADMIVNMSRLVGGLLEDGERRSLQLAVDDIVARAIAAQPKMLPPESYATFSPTESGKRGRREYLAELRTMQALVRMIDGVDNGPLAKNTLQKLNPAYSRRIARTREEEARIVELYRNAFGDKLADLRKGQMRFPGVEVALSRLERISVALNMGTEINRKRLMDGYGWDAGTLQSIIDTLTQEDWAFVTSMWDYINSLYPEANKAHLDAHGVPLSKQDGVPVVTRFGIVQGQYFPLKYDPHRSSRAEQKALDAEAKQVAGRVGTRKASGFTKERVKGRVTMPVLLDFTVVVPRHVDEVVASITTQKALLDVGRIITHKGVEQVIVERHGRTVYKQLLSALREARNGQETARLAAERALIRLRNGATIVGLGWNLKTALLQMGGHTNSVVRLGGPNLGAIGGLPWLLKGIYRMGIGAQGMQNGLKFIVQRSEYMRNRRESQNREMADLRRKLEGGSVKGAAQSFIEQSSMFLIVRAQYYLVDGPLWLGAYEKAVGSGASEADAVASADQTVIDAQGGGEVYQLAGIQRGSPLLKLFTNFLSYSITTWNLNVNRTRATNFRNPGQAAAWALDMAILNWAPVLLTILAASVMATGGGDDEDDLQEQMVRQQLSFLMSQLGLFGQMGSAINEFSYSGPQGTRAFSDASKAVQAAGKDVERLLAGEDMTGDVIRPLNLALGAWFHYPAGALDRFVRGAWAMADGETNDPKALVSGPPRN